MERTYVFNQDGNNGNGGGSKFDIMAMLPNLMGSKGVDPGLLALLNQGRGSQDQWGGSWWFIWIILLWFCWGGNGFGNRFGNGGGLPAELNGDVGREYLMSAILRGGIFSSLYNLVMFSSESGSTKGFSGSAIPIRLRAFAAYASFCLSFVT